MLIVNAVIHRAPYFAPFDDPQVPQVSQLMGNGRLCHFENGRQITNANFGLNQCMNDPHTGEVTQCLKY